MTHEGVESPRISLTLSIQSSMVAKAMEALPPSLGGFQRFMYVIGNGPGSASEPASLFSKGVGTDPHEMAYTTFVTTLARFAWAEAGREVALEFEGAAQERLDELNREFIQQARELSSTDPTLAEFVRRWIEQVIKLVQVFHVAQRLGNNPDKVNLTDLQKLITLDTLVCAIKFHEILRRDTLVFVDRWVREVKTGLEGLSVERVKAAVYKAYEGAGEECEGVSSSEILKNLPKVKGDVLWPLIEANPDQFRVVLGGVSGRAKLVRPITNVVDFAPMIQEGGKNAA